MTKYIKYAYLFIAALLLGSCAKDEEKFIADKSNAFKTQIIGLVLDEADLPIADVSVNYGGQTVLTDKDGYYTFKNVAANDVHNFVSLKKTGYFEGAKAFTLSKETNVELKSILIKQQFDKTFNAGSGGKISNGNVDISFPANAIVVESTGEVYNGNVAIAIHYIDPTSREGLLSMPGNLSAVNANNDFGSLKSFGMVNVDMLSSDGKKLQLKNGSKAKMSCVIAASLLDKAKESLPMWSFDLKTGVWKEEGIAKKEGNKYVGEVSHFSSWNYDTFHPSINLSGRVVDDKGKPLTVFVNFKGQQSGVSVHGHTNIEGVFSGRVVKDEELLITIYANDFCFGTQQIFTATIGPFSSDTDIGEIVIQSSVLVEVNINGSLLDCTDMPLNDFKTKIFVDNKLYSVESSGNANFQRNLTVCAGSNVSIIFVNVLESKESNTIVLNIGQNNLGSVKVCDQESDFIKFSIEELGITKIFVDSLGFYSSPETKWMIGIKSPGYLLDLKYLDNNANSFSPGTYLVAYIYLKFNQGTDYEYKDGFDTFITITQGGHQGDKIKGTFSSKLKLANSPGTVHTIKGSFQVTF